MPNTPKKPTVSTFTYSTRPDYHVFLTLVYHDLVDEINASMGLRHVIKQLTKTNPYYAELFQKAGEIQEELELVEAYLSLEQNAELKADLHTRYGQKKNLSSLLLEWRLQKPEEFKVLLAQAHE